MDGGVVVRREYGFLIILGIFFNSGGMLRIRVSASGCLGELKAVKGRGKSNSRVRPRYRDARSLILTPLPRADSRGKNRVAARSKKIAGAVLHTALCSAPRKCLSGPRSLGRLTLKCSSRGWCWSHRPARPGNAPPPAGPQDRRPSGRGPRRWRYARPEFPTSAAFCGSRACRKNGCTDCSADRCATRLRTDRNFPRHAPRHGENLHPGR